MQLTINPEYAKLVPELSKEQYASLEESIKKNGLWIPIVINKKNEILDGHHRYDICVASDITFKTIVRDFESKTDEIIFVGECNLKRRQLLPIQRIQIVRNLKPYYIEQAEKNLANAGAGLPILAKVDTREELSLKADVSHGTFDKGIFLLDQPESELKKKVTSGTTTISSAYKQINMKEKNLIVRDIPEGQFDLIYIDPPWESKSGLTRGSPENHYNTMDDDSIINLKLPMADDCIVFLWSIASMQTQALDCLRAWGLTYKTQMIWDKETIGVGYWTRTQHEILIIATKGDVPAPDPAQVKSSVYREKKSNHSAKPEYFIKLIESYYPVRKKLEMFARNKREGWQSWGNNLD